MRKSNRVYLKKAAAAAALAIFFEAAVLPSLNNSLWRFESEQYERGSFGYVHDVLKENRTGLGSMEELKLAEVIFIESVSHKLDPLFVLALIKTESTFYNWSKSFTGAVGLMQIQPSTGKEVAAELKLNWKGEETLLNPYLNVKMGVHYFSALRDRYNDDTIATLAAYNIGPGYFDSRQPYDDAGARFATKVLRNYRDFKEKADFY